jgi:hypothetical protein
MTSKIRQRNISSSAYSKKTGQPGGKKTAGEKNPGKPGF